MKNKNRKKPETKKSTHGNNEQEGNGKQGIRKATVGEGKGCRRSLWKRRVAPEEVVNWWWDLHPLGKASVYWVIAVLREANADEALEVAGLVRKWFGVPGEPESKGAFEPDVRNN